MVCDNFLLPLCSASIFLMLCTVYFLLTFSCWYKAPSVVSTLITGYTPIAAVLSWALGLQLSREGGAGLLMPCSVVNKGLGEK